jgi:hypothetical protein
MKKSPSYFKVISLSCPVLDKSNSFFVVQVTVVNADYNEMTFLRKKKKIP